MNTILYYSASGVIYETDAYTTTEVDQLVDDQGLQSLSSADHQFDFWFSPAPRRCQRRINRRVTELLLATTTFTAKSVPLLRGCVVVGTHDADGDLDGLSWHQLDLIAERHHALNSRERRVLNRRILRGDHRPRRDDQPALAPVVHLPAVASRP